MKKVLSMMLVLAFVVSSFALTVTMVSDTGGLGDKSFNDGTWAGVLRAKDELKANVKVLISKEQTDYVTNLSNAAKESDVVIAVGFMMTSALFDVAPQFPRTKFIGIDIAPSQGTTIPSNVALYLFKEQESAFLVGYLSASMTKTGKLGFIGGIEIPPVKRFEFGYRAGIKAYNEIHNKNVEAILGYAGGFGDVAKGKQMAMAQFAQGADIIFHAAGATGNGAFDAAKEKGLSFYGLDANATLKDIIDKYYEKGRGYFAVGVDSDQDYLAPGFGLASAMKRVDTAAFLGIKSSRSARSFKSGVHTLGLKENGVDISPMKYTKGMVSNSTFAELAYLSSLIKQGQVNVPDSEDGLASFDVTSVKFPF
ncbi:BMP family ABC transporter substrate-binding protein [Tepiditoga spiralis]|uniref:BMP family ABC transporter substrate-binding protein n=1 Tax=Tepiditoga spiralis TaxID=2108365 RepID=A0A7G1GBD7_9BACT|nr:BMP family ABC transporter substrate-binding protein [Tepiditoga spiralis]BBE30999.1 BMP family ABC transporter substrate-binding protein [Tepiditoga spiralis]